MWVIGNNFSNFESLIFLFLHFLGREWIWNSWDAAPAARYPAVPEFILWLSIWQILYLSWWGYLLIFAHVKALLYTYYMFVEIIDCESAENQQFQMNWKRNLHY